MAREPRGKRAPDTAAAPAPRTPPDAEREAGKWRLYAWIVALVLALDIVTKVIVQATLPEYRPIPVLGDVFRLTYIFNPGAAFGLHLGPFSRILFGLLALVAVVVLFLFYRGTPVEDRWRRISIALVTGGAVGNLIDRIREPRGVIDFFDIGFGDVRWPVFNIADIAVTTGAIMLAISLWREETEPHDERADA